MLQVNATFLSHRRECCRICGADPWSARDALVPLFADRIKPLPRSEGRRGRQASALQFTQRQQAVADTMVNMKKRQPTPGERMIESARQALAFAKGETTHGCEVHVPAEIDVKSSDTSSQKRTLEQGGAPSWADRCTQVDTQHSKR